MSEGLVGFRLDLGLAIIKNHTNWDHVVLSVASEHHRLPSAQPNWPYATTADNAVPANAHSTDAVTCIKSLFYPQLSFIYRLKGIYLLKESFNCSVAVPLPLCQCPFHNHWKLSKAQAVVWGFQTREA